ncbi:MAG: type II secretion system protein [Victivallales bacterium]|jgi:prepilin-type N-terminal cleavage/methylation domain-containing protein|nr:type II secretion system protein [Victivallales bacterium]
MKRGFTLIEMLVVLVILVILLGTVLPRVLRMPKRVQIETAHTRILSALRDCAMQAVASGRTVRVRLAPEGRSFLVTRSDLEEDVLSDSELPEDRNREPRDGSSLVLPNKPIYAIPKGVSWELDDDEEQSPLFVFHPDGGASGPDLVFVVVKRRFLLHVDRLTGRPDILEVED